MSVSFAHAATKTTVMSEEKLAQCYKQAQNLPARLNDCLTQELSMVKKEHKDVTERVFLIAKALDKKKGNKSVTDSHMRLINLLRTMLTENACEKVNVLV